MEFLFGHLSGLAVTGLVWWLIARRGGTKAVANAAVADVNAEAGKIAADVKKAI